MSLLNVNPAALKSLQDKVVVLTGGCSGIGHATAIEFLKHDARVVVGDVAVELGQQLQAQFGSNFCFVKCDASSYKDQLELFATAQAQFTRVDIVIANAGIAIFDDYFAPSNDINEEPAFREVDVNLRGALYTARIGMHYFRRTGGGDLIMMSSVGGFKETAYVTPYVATKHGVIGIMRGLRPTTLAEDIRVNVICPGMTLTAMTKGIEAGVQKLGLPINQPEDVGRAMLICATANRAVSHEKDKEIPLPFHGKIIFVFGGQSFEIEDGLQALEPSWLGEENSKALNLGQQALLGGEMNWAS